MMTLNTGGLGFGSDREGQRKTGQKCRLNDSDYMSSSKRKEKDSDTSVKSRRRSPCSSSIGSRSKERFRYRMYSKKRESDEDSSVELNEAAEGKVDQQCDDELGDHRDGGKMQILKSPLKKANVVTFI